ncbi:hypothetical protein PG993_012280 [Apiospora rasikravindrae]|uniref:Uncharacterized protein n=1 Tax=Apiospora rasikravindrae TaxID=990691 RepID=A0ABR1S4B3_9PEZI
MNNNILSNAQPPYPYSSGLSAVFVGAGPATEHPSRSSPPRALELRRHGRVHARPAHLEHAGQVRLVYEQEVHAAGVQQLMDMATTKR